MSAEVATTGSFVGADVDGLDHLSQEFSGAAEIVDMVKTACEVIVAAASIFGPFGAAFVAYLKGTVIPWLTKVSAALKAMSKVLGTHSAAQKDASSNATSLPSYQGTANLPTTSTHDAPQLPAATPTTPVTAPPVPSAATTVTAPATIGGSAPGTPATTPATTSAAAGSGATPFVQAITALTGLVTAVDHLVHPGASGAAASTTTPSTPTTPTTPTAPAVSAGGIDLGGLTPLHPGDTVGVLSVPVDVAPDGTITPLGHPSLDTPPPTTPPTTPPTSPVTHAGIAAPHPDTSIGNSGGPTGIGGSPSSGGAPSGATPSGGVPSDNAPIGAAPADAVTTAAHVAAPVGAQAAHGTQAAPELRTQTIGSHDGLFTGLGQATGIGAGAAALARAVLSEARQHGDGSVLGAAPLPFEADADLPVRTEIFQGSIG